MTEHFINEVLKTSVASLCQKMGWDAAQTSTVDILADLWKRQLLLLGKACHRYAEHNGRSEVNLDDMSLAFRELNVSVPELEEYVQNFDPVRLPYRPPRFPVSKQSHLNLLRPGSEEVLTRPVHIHEYMPPWTTTEEKLDKVEVNGISEKEDRGNSSSSHALSPHSDSSKFKDVPEDIKMEEADGSISLPQKSEPVEIREEDGEVSELSASDSGFRSFAGSSKRGSHVGENPALKRVRILMEEEGHPLREISSVMMTTSGFLSSSREGRLPDARPPSNRDFFDLEPVIEKKKKIVTMKKIVEGVKKIEKENQDDVELFGKLDKLVAPERPRPSEGLKKIKEHAKEDGERKLKLVEKDTKADKLKIFKKKAKDVEKHKKEDREKPQIKTEIKVEPELEDVSSRESFNDGLQINPEKDGSEEKQKRKRKELHHARKEKKRERERLVPGVIPIPRISPNVFPSHFEPEMNRDKNTMVKHPKSKKSTFPSISFGGDEISKPLKPKKMRPFTDIKSLIPEISINVSKQLPPPPELKPFFGTMSMAPGLIPTNFGPPPPLRFAGSHLSPSITITPAATKGLPQKESKKSGSGLPVPSNVCSSVTITRIDVPNSQELPSQYNSNPPGIGLAQSSGKQSPLPVIQPDNTSGITITPILMTGDHNIKTERVEKPGAGLSSTSMKLEEELRSKEQRRKDKEKRKELKKEKKKEKREKLREKERIREKDEKHVDKKERKEKVKEKAREFVEQTVPKITLKIHSNASTPVDSPSRMSDRTDTPPPPPQRKITIKPIEDIVKRRTPSPELAKFSPLVTRPSKALKVNSPKPSPPVASLPEKTVSEKKSSGKSKSRKASSSQSGLVTETVGFYIDEHGDKVWICPAVGCGREDDGSPMIGCDICDDWYHFACVGIEVIPDDNEHWYCPRCVKKGARKGR